MVKQEICGVSKFSRQLVKDDRVAAFLQFWPILLNSLCLSSFLLDGMELDVFMELSINEEKHWGTGFGITRLNMNNRRLDSLRCFLISKVGIVSFVTSVSWTNCFGPNMENITSRVVYLLIFLWVGRQVLPGRVPEPEEKLY
ncbi:hypothetical protein Tco_0549430 [Tanacetum coccineum]